MFIDAPRSNPDRGWWPHDVRSVLDSAGVESSIERVGSEADVVGLVRSNPSALFWPLTFTISSEIESSLLAEVLVQKSATYVGASPRTARLSSKLQLKQALRRVGLQTPSYRILPTDEPPHHDRFPAFVKTEYSCDSIGVRLADSQQDLMAHVQYLRQFEQRIFIEDPAGSTEYTSAIIVVGGDVVTGTLEMSAPNARYVDEAAKADASLVTSRPAEPEIGSSAASYIRRLATLLRLDGYLRLDWLLSGEGDLLPIDLNVLPYLNTDSYLPAAICAGTALDYQSAIATTIASSSDGRQAAILAGALKRFVDSHNLTHQTSAL